MNVTFFWVNYYFNRMNWNGNFKVRIPHSRVESGNFYFPQEKVPRERKNCSSNNNGSNICWMALYWKSQLWVQWSWCCVVIGIIFRTIRPGQTNQCLVFRYRNRSKDREPEQKKRPDWVYGNFCENISSLFSISLWFSIAALIRSFFVSLSRFLPITE